MIDKSKELQTSIDLINQKLHFTGKADGVADFISIDYTPPLGDGLGYTSLELLLLSLSSCVGSSVLVFLRKMKKTISGFTIESLGKRKTEHPTGFESIKLKIIVKSEDVSKEDLDKVITLSEELYCPVWSMLKGNVEMVIEYVIIP